MSSKKVLQYSLFIVEGENCIDDPTGQGVFGGGVDGGALCRMSITQNSNVALRNLGKPHVAISI